MGPAIHLNAMSETSATYHEPYELLSEETKNMHRAVVSVMEELEAIDWYQQRADACTDPELRDILVHNKHEEIEHAMMTLEWIRRHNPKFDEQAETYLFTQVPIVEVEEQEEDESARSPEAPARSIAAAGSLGIGSLKGEA